MMLLTILFSNRHIDDRILINCLFELGRKMKHRIFKKLFIQIYITKHNILTLITMHFLHSHSVNIANSDQKIGSSQRTLHVPVPACLNRSVQLGSVSLNHGLGLYF